MSSAFCLTLVVALTFSLTNAKDISSCQGKHSLWDKWYDGCKWCVCTENGPICTDTSCSRNRVDRCDPVGGKWRDGCYRCQCTESGIACFADHKCVHAMGQIPVPCDNGPACVCGLDGVPSCLAAERERIGIVFPPSLKKRQGWKYFTNEPRVSKERHDAEDMSCRKAKRWYAGSRRCFCGDGARTPLCGDPRYIAHRVDGYRFKTAQCYSNQEWSYNCKRCMCRIYGYGFCARIPNCKRGSLLIDRKILHRIECQPESKWREGCKDCTCSSDGRRVCVDFDCNTSGRVAETRVMVNMPAASENTAGTRVTVNMPKLHDIFDDGKALPGEVHETKLKSRPRFQIPPAIFLHMGRRFRPRVRKPDIQEVLCEGKFKPGEKFYKKCNYCKCSRNGDSMCTAIWCV